MHLCPGLGICRNWSLCLWRICFIEVGQKASEALETIMVGEGYTGLERVQCHGHGDGQLGNLHHGWLPSLGISHCWATGLHVLSQALD